MSRGWSYLTTNKFIKVILRKEGKIMLDYLICNGHVFDPTDEKDVIEDIGICNGKIVDLKVTGHKAKHVFDVKGCCIFPGLIDVHSHVFSSGSILGVAPDAGLAHGVTTVVDAGSAGVQNYNQFHENDVLHSISNVYGLFAYNRIGQVRVAFGEMEDYDRKHIDIAEMKELFKKYHGEVLGLKMRFQEDVVGKQGLHYLEEMIEVAEEIGCHVVIHTTKSPVSAAETLKLLRKGDVFCHCFQGIQNSILDENGNVCSEAFTAKERGVFEKIPQ